MFRRVRTGLHRGSAQEMSAYRLANNSTDIPLGTGGLTISERSRVHAIHPQKKHGQDKEQIDRASARYYTRDDSWNSCVFCVSFKIVQ